MQPYDTANITWQLFAALSCRKLSAWTLAVHFNDAIAEVEISGRVFVRKLATEKFRQCLHLNLVDFIKFKPAAAAWNDHRLASVLFQAKLHFSALALFLNSFIIGVSIFF